jgi:predicted ATPase/transcriptional regulator with XRE-family HTH domain
MAVETSFGRWLQRRRKALDLTQEELGQRVGCAAETLRKIEADVRRPSRQIAERLAAALEIPEVNRAAFVKAARSELAVDRLAHPTQGVPEVTIFPAESLSSEIVSFPFTQLTPTIKTKLAPSPNKPTTNLPSPLTSFIGREKEQSDVIDLITKHRLVTLTGSGGVGKTRLAIKVALEIFKQFPDGVWFLDLAPLSDPDLVPSTLARVLGLREVKELSVTDLVTDYLRSRTVLVLFDNCEHLIESSTRFVHSLLISCPYLAVLATSREALRVSGEIHYHLPPLVIPTLNTGLSMDEISKLDSVKLFKERSEAASPGFVINERNTLVIAQICHRLDGIPLAIELAAAHANVLTVEQILKRLDNRFSLLTRGSRTVLPRQQTLLATIEWSYDLLTDLERSLFRRLAVFVGGFSLEAAEVICGRKGLMVDDILEILERLVDKSLVSVESVVSTGDARYRLLETIREFLFVRLQESNETSMFRDAHLEYFTEFLHEVGPKLFTQEEELCLARIEVEMDNLRAALDWRMTDIVRNSSEFSDDSVYLSKSHQLIELCKHLGEVLNAQAKYNEAIDIYKLMLKTAQESGELVAQPQALLGLAVSSEFQGDNSASLDLARQAEILARGVDNHLALASALRIQGVANYRLGNLQTASLLGEQAFSLAVETKDQNETARSLSLLAAATYLTGNYEVAKSYWQIALSIFQKLGNHRFEMDIMSNLGAIADSQGDYESAFRYYQEAWKIAHRVGYRDGEIVFLSNKGGAQASLKKYVTAEVDLRKSIEMAGTVGSWCLPSTYAYLAEAYLGQKNEEKALDAALQALALAQESQTPEYIGVAWRVLGMIAVHLKKPVKARREEKNTSTNHHARDCFKVSEEILSKTAIHVEKARTLREWARYELSQGNEEKGAAMWYEARRIFEEIGARREVERMATMPS